MRKFILLFVLASTMLFGCGNNEADKKALTGEWKEIPGKESFKDYYFSLKEDGSYKFSYKQEGKTINRSGKWEIDDGHISFLEGNDILVKYKSYQVKNDTLTLGLGGAESGIHVLTRIK